MPGESAIFEVIQKLKAEGRSFVVASVAALPSQIFTQEEAARFCTGNKIVVAGDGRVFGSTGSDTMDAMILGRVGEFLRTGKKNVSIRSSSLGLREARGAEEASQKASLEASLSAAQFELVIERFEAVPKLVIVGAGEVGRAIAEIAQGLDFKIIVVDEQPNLANRARFPMADRIICDPDLSKAMAAIPVDESCYIVIAFSASDDRPIRYYLNKPWAYCGMLGSKKKIQSEWEKLRAEGVPGESLRSVHAPVGFDIGAQSPREIAIAVLAEIIAVRNMRD